VSTNDNTNTAEDGSTVEVHYRGTLSDGTVFDSSYDRDEPIGFQVGAGTMISGFNDAVVGMTVGEKKTVNLKPQEAYGDVNPNAVTEVSRMNFPNDFAFIPGQVVQGSNENGHPVVGTINEVKSDVVVIDFNHPMAGKVLNFEIELVSVKGLE
jgi:peptidylprolyl isomerase